MTTPAPSPQPTIAMVPPTAATDGPLVRAITELVNEVYAVAEAGLWREGSDRTTAAEVAALIADDELAVAQLDGAVVGSVHVHEVADGVGEFGMLVSHPAHRSHGTGRRLIDFSEDRCRRRGSGTMQLELLVPRRSTHPAKVALDAWYTRLGYRPVRTDAVDERYPQLAPMLAVPCEIVVYHKPLPAPDSR